MSSSSGGSYSNLDLGKPGKPDLFSSITDLSLDYAAIKGGCAWGAPRFVVRLQNPANHAQTASVTAYVGSLPSFNCYPGDGFVNSGNLASPDAGSRWAVGNSGAYVNYNDPTIQHFASWTVTDVFLCVDGGGAFSPGGQDIAVNNVTLNHHVASAQVHVG